MKKISLLLALAMLLSLTACRKKEPEPPTPPEPPAPVEENVLRLEELRLEFPRNGLAKAELAQAVKQMPELLKAYFAETGTVEAERITVTVGSSSAATAQALTEGHIDLAFLPGTAFAALDDGAAALLADAHPLDDGSFRSGTRALLCAAPTAYGEQLASRSSSGKPLSYTEVERAHWGTVEGTVSGCFELWLADSFGEPFGGTVTAYDSEEALLCAAADGEVDAIAIRDDAREAAKDTWTGDGAIREQLPVLDVTETVYTTVAAVRPELAEGAFAPALEQVLQRMSEEHPELMAALGAEAFASVTEDGLTATRRLAALAEE